MEAWRKRYGTLLTIVGPIIVISGVLQLLSPPRRTVVGKPALTNTWQVADVKEFGFKVAFPGVFHTEVRSMGIGGKICMLESTAVPGLRMNVVRAYKPGHGASATESFSNFTASGEFKADRYLEVNGHKAMDASARGVGRFGKCRLVYIGPDLEFMLITEGTGSPDPATLQLIQKHFDSLELQKSYDLAAENTPVSSNDSIEIRMQYLAQVAVETTDPGSRTNFDFSAQSLLKVDEILDKLPQTVSPANRDEELFSACLAWGAYVGEVIRKQQGAGEWSETQDDAGRGNYPLRIHGQTLFPCSWTIDRVQTGPSASVFGKYQTFALEKIARQVGAQTNTPP